MTEKEFLELSKKGNLVPVYREVYGDLETPVAAYMKLAKSSKYSFLLESVEGGEKLARYSFLAKDPDLVLRAKDRMAQIIRRRVSHRLRYRPLGPMSPMCDVMTTGTPSCRPTPTATYPLG